MQNAFQNLNWLAIIAGAVSAFVLGGLWYSPLLFAERWMKETGITEESTKNTNMVKIFSNCIAIWPNLDKDSQTMSWLRNSSMAYQKNATR